MSSFKIAAPTEFNFDLCLQFLQRSPKELLHHCEGKYVTKFLTVQDQKLLFEVSSTDSQSINVQFLNTTPSATIKLEVKKYITEWFDLATNLKPFYALAKKDDLLKDLIKKYYGYRIVGQPDLFESLVWAVLGQQINLQFAYTLKQRFVEQFGEKLSYSGNEYYLFPTPQKVVQLTDEHLLPLQFSRQKSKYVVLIAEAFMNGTISKEKLKGLTLQEAKEQLIKIKGVGNWTANYALMKTFRYPDAFPLEDAGVHNAIKNLKKMRRKPALGQVKRLFKKYKGWEAYATLYLWKSL
jgi:DNA-3-methyladenine glycosylase II